MAVSETSPVSDGAYNNIIILFAFTWIKDWYSSLSLCGHKSTSLGPAFVFKSGIVFKTDLVPSIMRSVVSRDYFTSEPTELSITIEMFNTSPKAAANNTNAMLISESVIITTRWYLPELPIVHTNVCDFCLFLPLTDKPITEIGREHGNKSWSRIENKPVISVLTVAVQ